MSICHAILTHETADRVERMVSAWAQSAPKEDVFVLFGGTREEFERIDHPGKAFIEDPRLRVLRPRENRQSYSEIFRHLAKLAPQYSHFYFAEYDLVPLVSLPTLHKIALDDCTSEEADVLFPLLSRVDGTCQEVFLQHRDQPGFLNCWKTISCRPDSGTILWALLPGSFWSSGSILAIAEHPEPVPVYFEIYLPTLLHHLGQRVRQWPSRSFVIHGGGNLRPRLARLKAAGALVAHPVKNFWI